MTKENYEEEKMNEDLKIIDQFLDLILKQQQEVLDMFLNFVTTVNFKKNLDLNLDLYLKKNDKERSNSKNG